VIERMLAAAARLASHHRHDASPDLPGLCIGVAVCVGDVLHLRQKFHLFT
jgi:phytoene/squalene synthetase